MKHTPTITRFALYRTRKEHSPYPRTFTKIFASKGQSWILVEGVLSGNELDRCDLTYHGHGMTYERCLEEMERLERGSEW